MNFQYKKGAVEDKFGRKKAPERQQNVQSIDGAVTNGSSSCEENSSTVLCVVPMDEDAFRKFQDEGSMCYSCG
ncbi:mini-chromosome maintenance complex-binding protein-like [Pyrus ussuriensis x Pyrus communis]|uniref:Mini-chromosome maintenance complex-binding protein-like n=1 Tax=Pyrus ussuriensis x Pyrus communis TaxID=2448454 RepID=A0A5N5HQA8_9ROSA|nr:mini-chromosome maintenance complex-binding protein-like [Pyrus ussuriensis x Pyrus communis]